MEPLFYAFFFLLILLIGVLFMIKRQSQTTAVIVERPAFPAGYLFENQFDMLTPKFNRKVKQYDASGNLL